MTLLLKQTPATLLKRTGLAGVFEDALMPCLSYLPSLTPVDESIEILDAAYPALLALANARYTAGSVQQPQTRDEDMQAARIKSLDKLIRHGVLHGMTYAGEHVRVAEVLVKQLRAMVKEEGIDSVKHLQETVPLLSNIMADPFALAHVPLLREALQTMKEVIRNGWARMDRWKAEVMKGPCLLWIRIQGEGKQGDEELCKDMSKCLGLLDGALRHAGHEEGLKEDIESLIRADENLKGLFDGVLKS